MSARATMNGKPVFHVPAKSVLNLESGFKEKLLCDGPTFTAGTACVYSCSFCYVPAMMRRSKHLAGVEGKHQEIVIRRHGALEALMKQLTNSKGQPRFDDPADRRVVYSSPLVDVAGNLELVRETVEICDRILRLTHWQIRLLSKSNLLPKLARQLMDSGAPGVRERVVFGVSTGTLDDELAHEFESGTPWVSKRLQSLHHLQDEGFRTFGMVCPSLPLEGNHYLKWALEMARAIRAERCEHVWAEVLNVRGESMTRTVKALAEGRFGRQAELVHQVSTSKQAWEEYARATFDAHARIYGGMTGPDGKPKLRFLQYVTPATSAWWQSQAERGAIVL